MRSRKFAAGRCTCGHECQGFNENLPVCPVCKKAFMICPDCKKPFKITVHEIPEFVRPGRKVDYSSIIGEEPTILGCTITKDVFVLGETPCVMIDKKRGAVAVEALSQAVR